MNTGKAKRKFVVLDEDEEEKEEAVITTTSQPQPQPSTSVYKFQRAETLADKSQRLKTQKKEEAAKRANIYDVVHAAPADRGVALQNLFTTYPNLQSALGSLEELEAVLVLSDFLSQSSLSLDEYISTTRRGAGVVNRAQLEDDRIFFTRLLGALRNPEANTRSVSELLRTHIERERSGDSADTYAMIAALNPELLDRFASFFLRQFSDPKSLKSLEDKYLEFVPVVKRLGRFRNIAEVSSEPLRTFPTTLSKDLLVIAAETVTDGSQHIGREMLSASLRTITDSDYYSANSAFVRDVITLLARESVINEKFVEKLASICVYIRNNVPIAQGGKFATQINEEYFTPETLVALGPQEKLPEVYDNDSVSVSAKEKIFETYTQLETSFRREFLEDLFKYQNPYVSIHMSEQRHEPKPPNLRDFTPCENAEDVKDVPSGFLVTMVEDGKTYCFDARLVASSVNSEERFVNKYTGSEVPLEVLYTSLVLTGNKPKCYNFLEAADIPKKHIITVTEKNRKYCLDSRRVFAEMQAGVQPLNPYTSAPVPEEILDIVRAMHTKDDDNVPGSELTPGLMSLIKGAISQMSKKAQLPDTAQEISSAEMELPNPFQEPKPFYDILYSQIRNQLTSEEFRSFCKFLVEISATDDNGNPYSDISEPCDNIKKFRAYLQSVVFAYCDIVIRANVLEKLNAILSGSSSGNLSDIINLNYGHRDLIEKYMAGEVREEEFVALYKQSTLCSEETTTMEFTKGKKRFLDTTTAYKCPLVGSVEIEVLKDVLAEFEDTKLELQVYVIPSAVAYLQAKSKFDTLVRLGASIDKVRSAFKNARRKLEQIEEIEAQFKAEIRKSYENSTSTSKEDSDDTVSSSPQKRVILPVVYDLERKIFADGLEFAGIHLKPKFSTADLKHDDSGSLEFLDNSEDEDDDDAELASLIEDSDAEQKVNDEDLEALGLDSDDEEDEGSDGRGKSSDEDGGETESESEFEDAGPELSLCKMCKNKLSGEPYKTVIMSSSSKNPKSKIVGFCSVKCFDNYDLKEKKIREQ